MENSLFGKRNVSIDMLRGLTMLLMVFVNDLWSVGGVPHSLEHFERLEDGMGLADIVFPMFLFAMGMSVPYAVERRFSKGFSGESTLGHILSRTFALLIMGVFTVNTEGDFGSVLGYSVGFYRVLMVAAFILIWNHYPAGFKAKKWLQALGTCILGLIGWTYCFVAVTYLLTRKKPLRIVLVWFALCAVNLLLTRMRDGSQIIAGPSFIGDMASALKLSNAPYAVMATGGMLLSLAENRLSSVRGAVRVGYAAAMAAALALAAAFLHHWWIVSKLLGTLPWCLYVSAISVALYAVLRVLESYGKTGWFRPFSASGTATLTVYMMPYLLYSLFSFVGLHTFDFLTGVPGLLKCLLFSLLCVALTSLLGRVGIKLKI